MKPTAVIFCSILTCLAVSVARANSSIEDLDASYQFLVTPRSTHGGALYAPTEGSLKGVALPLSFYDSDRYWGAYVCALPKVNCSVTDYYDPHDYTLKPRNADPAASLQAERVNVHNGSNIYDAAT